MKIKVKFEKMATQPDIDEQDIGPGISKLKLTIIIVGGLLIAGLIGGGVLYGLGFFDKSTDFEAALAILESDVDDSESSLLEVNMANVGQKVSYFEITPNLVSNAAGTRKMIQLKVAVMTDYDEEERILGLVKVHDYPIRSAMLQVLSEQSEEMIEDKDFRQNLSSRLTTEINAVLSEIEGIDGIRAVYFTEFLIQ
jgi:flagellar FliL protein